MKSEGRPADESRRRWLGAGGAAVAAATVAPGLLLLSPAQGKQSDAGVSSKNRWGLLVDTDKCAGGCDACVQACNAENGLGGGTRRTDSQWIRKIEIKPVDGKGKALSLPVMCQHCEHPPCVDVCPTGASFKRADGIVLVDRHICIGCRYCMMACPYKARSFVHEPLTDQKPDVPRGQGCVEACSLCVHRVDRGEQPACVEACAKEGHAALLFGDLNDAGSEISKSLQARNASQIRADLRLNPGVRYQGI